MKFCFGDIVVVDNDLIGVVVKCWESINPQKTFTYDVYVRLYNGIKQYSQDEIQRYMVRHKYLSEEEKQYQEYAIKGEINNGK